MTDATLYEKLKKYAVSDYYPFHMPGHKRRGSALFEPTEIDITEIEGFDDLHHPTGLIREAEERAAALWGVRRSFLLVNGSTVGILSAMSAAAEKGSRVLIGQNCHKSVYHACFLNDYRTSYLRPRQTHFCGDGQITPEELRRELDKNPDTKLVVVTSPTYEGIISDIASLSEEAHQRGAILLVDEAHGAHLKLSDAFPEPAEALGADLVVQSLHKTLPSLTQTAVLHLVTDRVSEEQVQRYLDIFETSSPSYVLLASMDRCIELLRNEREKLFSDYLRRLSLFYESTEDLKHFSVMTDKALKPGDAFAVDPGKLVIRPLVEGVSGRELMRALREVYHLELERAMERYVIGMTSISDSDEGFRRLSEALHEMDRCPDILKDYRRKENPTAKEDYEIYRGFLL